MRAHAMAPVIDIRSARESRLAERSYSQLELAEMADGLRRLLDAIEGGKVTAPGGTVARLEGAVAALEALAKGDTPEGLVP